MSAIRSRTVRSSPGAPNFVHDVDGLPICCFSDGADVCGVSLNAYQRPAYVMIGPTQAL